MRSSKIPLLGLLFTFSIGQAAYTQAAPILISGQYSNVAMDCLNPTSPIVLSSFDDGESWKTILPNFKLPSDKIFSDFNSTICKATGCLAVGSDSGTINQHPLIAKSDATLTLWTIQSMELPWLTSSGSLENVNCQGNNCIAEGTYTSGINILGSKPLILSSNNSGTTWHAESLPRLRYFGYNNSAFSCGDGFCVLIGNNYDAKENANSLVFFTNGNADHSWTMADSIVGLPFSPTTAIYTVLSLSCNGNNCVAVGFYEPGENNPAAPMILVSNDKGKSWQFNNTAISNLPESKSFVWHSVACSDRNCVASGTSTKDNVNIVSHDAGATWSVISSMKRAQNVSTATYFTNNTCIITGFDENNKLYTELSNDGGYNWILNKNLTNDSTDNTFVNSIYCKSNTCIIIGTYQNASPFILISHDGGMSWMLRNQVENLPENISYITLTNISNEMSSTLAMRSLASNRKQLLCMKK